MNPNLDDPNNHVPPISPGDNWDDLDDSTERSRVGLPPRRVERGLPPKKELHSEKVSLRSRFSSLEENGEEADASRDVEDEDEGVQREQPLARHEEIPIKPRRNLSRKAKREEIPEEAVEPPGEPAEIAFVLPNPKPGKRARVNEISPASPNNLDRPVRQPAVIPKMPPGGQEGEPKDVLKKRRRFLRGERSDWGGEEKRGSGRWMLVTGIGVAALVVVAVVLSQRGGRQAREEQSFYSKLELAEDEMAIGGKGADVPDKLLDSRPEAEGIFTAYATAKSPEDFASHIHAPERNTELIRKWWKPLGMEEGWKLRGDTVWYVREEGTVRSAVLEGTLDDFKPFKAVFRQDGGELKLDWKATTGYGSAAFADLQAGKGDGGEIRAWLSQADFYTFSFPEGEFRSFRITSPAGDTTIWGYAPAGSAIENELMELFKPGQITGESRTDVDAIIRRQPSGQDSLPNQWLIAEIIRLDWLDE